MILGIILSILGMISVIQSLRYPRPRQADVEVTPVSEKEPRLSLEPLVLITLSVVAFGLIIGPFGLVPALFAAIFFSCLRRVFKRPLEVFLIFVVLAGFCGVVFVHLLGMPMTLITWPS